MQAPGQVSIRWYGVILSPPGPTSSMSNAHPPACTFGSVASSAPTFRYVSVTTAVSPIRISSWETSTLNSVPAGSGSVRPLHPPTQTAAARAMSTLLRMIRSRDSSETSCDAPEVQSGRRTSSSETSHGPSL